MEEETHIAVVDFVILGVLDDPVNLLDSTVNVTADSAHEDDVLSGVVASLSTELNGKGHVFTDNTAYHVSITRIITMDGLTRSGLFQIYQRQLHAISSPRR